MRISRRLSFTVLTPLTAISLAAAATALVAFNRRSPDPETAQPEQAPGHPKLVVEELEYHLGVIDGPDKLAHTFVIRNEGDAPLELTRGPSNCKCTVAELPAAPIAPGGRAEIPVSFRLDPKPGPVSRSATLLTNDPEQDTIRLAIFGDLRLRVVAEPAPLTLFAPFYEKRTVQTLVYSQRWQGFALNLAGKSLEGMDFRIEPAAAEKLEHVQARSGYQVEIELPHEMGDQNFAEWIEFSAVPKDRGEQAQPVRLEIKGRIYGRATIHGPRIDDSRVLRLGAVERRVGVHENLILKVHDEWRELNISRIETSPDFLSVRVAPCSQGSAEIGLYRVEVIVPPDAPATGCMGEDATVVRLHTDHPRLPVIEFKVEFVVGGRG